MNIIPTKIFILTNREYTALTLDMLSISPRVHNSYHNCIFIIISLPPFNNNLLFYCNTNIYRPRSIQLLLHSKLNFTFTIFYPGRMMAKNGYFKIKPTENINC